MSLMESLINTFKDHILEFNYVVFYNGLNINNIYNSEELLDILNSHLYYELEIKSNVNYYAVLSSIKTLYLDPDYIMKKCDLLFLVAFLEKLSKSIGKIKEKSSLDNLSMYS